MKIQLSDKKIIADALVVWSHPGPEVDIVMDLKNLTFKQGSIEELSTFHVLDRLFPEEVVGAVANWRKCLAPSGKMFTVVDDFEYVARGFVGGDIDIELLNDIHNHPTQFTRNSLDKTLAAAGFVSDCSVIWYADVVAGGKFAKKHYELVFETKKL